MTVTLALFVRNLRLFFRDRLNVFFSLLSGIILFVLYTLFLARLQTDALAQSFPQAADQDIRAFVDSWMFSGIVLLTTLTSGLGALACLVDDRQSARFSDFLVAPIRRGALVGGYLLSAFTVALIMSAVVLALSILYLGLLDGYWLTPGELVRILLIMALCCIAFTSMAAFVATFLRTSGSFSALATVVGTAIGFIAGAYIPNGSLPSAVSSTISALPFAQGAMLLRRAFSSRAIDSLAGGSDETAAGLRAAFGVDLQVGDVAVAGWVAAAVLVAVAVGFTALAAARMSRIIR